MDKENYDNKMINQKQIGTIQADANTIKTCEWSGTREDILTQWSSALRGRVDQPTADLILMVVALLEKLPKEFPASAASMARKFS